MNYIVYQTNTGEILRTGVCSPDTFALQKHGNESVLEGTANDETQHVENGWVVESAKN